MRLLDLFSGLGGFSLAGHTLGMETAAFCECEAYPVSVLQRHYPGVPVFRDVKELSANALADTDRIPWQRWGGSRVVAGEESEARNGVRCASSHRSAADSGADGIIQEDLIITAGFPCQDLSYAGRGAGIEGERSGLYGEIIRLIGELRPGYVLLENVPAILTRGLDRVLGSLAQSGYGFVYGCVPACAVGAPHRRDRWWLVGWPMLGLEADRDRGMRIWKYVLDGLTPYGISGEFWGTPMASMHKGAGPLGSDVQVYRCRKSSLAAQAVTAEQRSGALNPDWVETLMGYPVGYTLPEGEPMAWLPGVWPAKPADALWPTPNTMDTLPQRSDEAADRQQRRGDRGGCKRERSGNLREDVVRWPAAMSTPQHPWEPPRLTDEKRHRTNRLKALGNSIVPQCAVLWLAAIQQEGRLL